MRSLCARVPINRGEFYRKRFIEAQILREDLVIKHNDSYLYIPLLKLPPEQWLNEISKDELDIFNHDFENYEENLNDYKKLLDLPRDFAKLLPTSYDIVGSIAMVKLPELLKDYSTQIGNAIIKTHKNISTVVWDKGVKGKLRLRDIQIIAGEENTITNHKEYGITLIVDVSKVYFSPRLSGEHYRISRLTQPGEIVLDMFAGIGSFAIMISKYSKAERIYCIDINKNAIEYLIKNIDQNKITNIFPLEGDVKNLINKIPKVDRIVMNLPLGAKEYLSEAFSVLNPKGIIHYHELSSSSELDNCKDWLNNTAHRYDYKLINLEIIDLGSYSPTMDHYCFDLTLEKM